MTGNLSSFTDILGDEIPDSQPISMPSTLDSSSRTDIAEYATASHSTPARGTGQVGNFRSVEELDPKYRHVFTYPYFNLVQSGVIDDALYSDKSMVVCAPTGSGKTVIFEMAIVQLLMEIENKTDQEDFKIIYMAPVKALCTERLTEWYSKFNKFGLLCIEVTGDTDVDFGQLQPYKIIITTPEKWDILTRRWRDHRGLVEMVKLFLIDEVHILNDDVRGPVLEAVVSRMKTIESAAQSAHRIEQLQKQYQTSTSDDVMPSRPSSSPRIRFVAVSATVSNPEDVATWLGTEDKPAVYYKFGDECRPVKIHRVVEGYPCPDGMSIFKFDIILNYKLWPIIQKYYNGKPTLIFCNTRKSVVLTAETLSREITITFNPEQRAKLTALAATIKNKKLQSLVLAGVGCHHAGMIYEERFNIEHAFRNRDLPILITTTTLAMGVNLPAHLVIVKNTQRYVNGAYEEYSISTVLQMLGRAGRPQFDTDATAVIMTRQKDKARYQALVGGTDPLQSYLHKRLAENLNSEAALGTVGDVAQCVQWLRSTFLYVRAAKDPKRYLGLTPAAPGYQISKKIEEMCVRAMNGLARSGLITMDEASCIASTEAGRLMSVFYLDLETMKLIMKIQGEETLEQLLSIICESHELSDMHLRVDERRCLNTLNRNQTAATIRFPMKGKINSRQMKLSCIIQAVLGCLPIPDPSLNQEAMKIMRTANRICKCLVAYVTRPELVSEQQKFFSAVLNSIILAKCVEAHLWENSPYVSRQLKGIGPTFSTLLATAGKVKFMLLEESHPRDLERIMNKAPPAGNMLKKQISLLPKYQLDATPLNEKTVLIRLLLLNQAYLSENMDELTAGESHKCYVVAGDSENHILLLNSFTDKHLISVYDGTMTFEITRKHNFEHKISVHCISSTFVGIDAECEYTFTNLMPTVSRVVEFSPHCIIKETPKKTVASTTKPKERKRKNTNDEIMHSNEKKKRENALAEKFRLLKESFTKASKELKTELQNTEKNAQSALHGLVQPEKFTGLPTTTPMTTEHTNEDISVNLNDSYDDDFDAFVDDEKFSSILNNIETEIIVNNQVPATSDCEVINKQPHHNIQAKAVCANSTSRKRKLSHKERNYKFLDLLERNIDISDDESKNNNDNGFSAAIKMQLDKYIQNSRYAPSTSDPIIRELINEDDLTTQNSEGNLISDLDRSLEQCSKTTNINKNITATAQEKTLESNNNTKAANNNIIFVPVLSNHTLSTIYDLPTPIHVDVDSTRNKPNEQINSVEKTQNNIEREGNTYNNINERIENIDDSVKINNKEEQLPSLVANDNTQHAFNKNFEKYSFDEKLNNDENGVQCQALEMNNRNLFKTEMALIPLDTLSLKMIPKEINRKDDYCMPQIYNSITQVTTNLLQRSPTQRSRSCTSFVEPYLISESKKPFHEDPTHERKIHENKHTFSTEKYNVHSKFTADHEIRITRRLKIDLDITETVLEEKLKPPNTILNDFDCTLKNHNDKVAVEPKLYELHGIADNLNRNVVKQMDQKCEVLSDQYKENISKSADNKGVCYQPYLEQNNHLDTQTIREETNREFIENNIKDNESYPKLEQAKEQSNQSDIDETKKNGREDQQLNRSNVENNIESVLQKYSKALSKTKNNMEPPTIPKTTLFQEKKHYIKSNKPFKISDIQNLNIELTKLCETQKTPDKMKHSDVEMENIFNDTKLVAEVLKKPNEFEKEKYSDNILTNQKKYDHFKVTHIANPNDIDYECTQASPVASEVNLTEEQFNIDHNLLDPKMFLKCYKNEYSNVEIIPPPPEFSDFGTTYSPKADVNDTNCCSNYDIDFNYDAGRDDYHLKNNLFEDNSNNDELNLTPSKEIEIWNLSIEDDFANDSFNDNSNLNQSYTALYRKIPESNTDPQNVYLNSSPFAHCRQGKLAQFKFNHKIKLKRRM